ncbi:MAG: cytochrome c [Bradymonadaceae bacterium]|nr:cytochrome c [Lujinxingiaceae bacterium]
MTTSKKLLLGIVLASVVALFGCDASGKAPKKGGSAPAAAAGNAKGPSSIDNGGITLVSSDPDMIKKGESLYLGKGCSACHQMDKRVVGPALRGITNRREPEWLARFILHPDAMVKSDAEAKKLLEEYRTPMPNVNLTAEEADAILAYLGSQK